MNGVYEVKKKKFKERTEFTKKKKKNLKKKKGNRQIRKAIFSFKERKKTYSSGYSLVVTDPTTNPPIIGLTKGERTGSRAFQYLWPYVEEA
jgi:hypothetical protein